MMPMNDNKPLTTMPDQLRDRHRQARAALSSETQLKHAETLCARLLAMAEVQQARHIAAYIAIRGEISLTAAIETLESSGAQFYLPVLRADTMHFAPWHSAQKLHRKGFGLLEPDAPEESWRAATELDLVLAPLVVFDQQCNRIGQGGGYYDRTFSFRRNTQLCRPTLLGVAHHSQQEPSLPVQYWDVPLDMIATDRHLHRRSQTSTATLE